MARDEELERDNFRGRRRRAVEEMRMFRKAKRAGTPTGQFIAEAQRDNQNELLSVFERRGLTRNQSVQLMNHLMRTGVINLKDLDIVNIDKKAEAIISKRGKSGKELVIKGLTGGSGVRRAGVLAKESVRKAKEEGKALETASGFTINPGLMSRLVPLIDKAKRNEIKFVGRPKRKRKKKPGPGFIRRIFDALTGPSIVDQVGESFAKHKGRK